MVLWKILTSVGISIICHLRWQKGTKMEKNRNWQNVPNEEDVVRMQVRLELEKLILSGKIYHMKSNEVALEILSTFKVEDDGKVGKTCEIVVRHFLSPTSRRMGISSSNVWYADTKIWNKILKKYELVEIKQACGELQKIDICDIMMYCPVVDFNIPLEMQFFVIPKDDFLQIMSKENYSGSGQVIRTKKSTNNTIVKSFQSFWCETRKKSSKKLANYIWDSCYNFPVVSEWREMA